MKQIDGYTSGENTASQIQLSTSDLIHFCGNWIWRAVDALVASKDFNSDPTWVADRLNISVEAAKDALDGLERIGRIKKSETGLVANAEFSNFDNVDLDRSDRFEIHNKIKDQITSRITSRDSYCNLVLLSSRGNVSDFYDGFCRLVEEFAAKSDADETSTEVFGMELSLARLSREQK